MRALLIAVYVFLLAPLVIVAGAAVNPESFLAFPPHGLSAQWFVRALTAPGFQAAFATSLEVSLSGTLLALLIGIPAAYALARHRVRLPRWLGVVFVLPVLIPEIVFGFALLKGVSVGMGVAVLPSLIAGHTLLVLPYAVRVVGASLAGFDFSVEEAAISLGARPTRAFLLAVLPNIRGGIVAAFTLAFITSLNDVSISVFLTGPGVNTLPIQILSYVEQFFDPTVAAVSVLMMGLTMLVMVAVERSVGLAIVAR